jgi:hypothetical protein
MLMPHSTYFQFDLRTKAATAAHAAILLSSGSDVIRRLDVRIGGQQVDNISRYGSLYAAIKTANAPRNYLDTDASILERMNVQLEAGAGANVYQADAVQCHIPLLSGLFTTERCLPTNLLNSPIVVTIELDTAANLNADAGFELEVSNAKLFFTSIDMGDAYNSALKAELGAQGLLRMSYTTFSGSEYSNQPTVNILLGENCSSLLGVICGTVGAVGKVSTGGLNSTGLFAVDGFVSSEYKIDGLQHPTYLIQGPHMAFAESQKLYSGIFNTDHTGSYGASTVLDNTSAATLAVSILGNIKSRDYPANKFVHGISTTRFHENTLSMVGTPVSNHIQITKLSTGAAGTFFVWTVKEHQLLLDASGTVSVAK